jgi:hypothetical protein
MENNIEITIKKLRTELSKYKASDNYSKYKIDKFYANVIEIAIALTELGVFQQRKITLAEEYWFKGGYTMSYDIEGDWENLVCLYNEVCERVKVLNYFR